MVMYLGLFCCFTIFEAGHVLLTKDKLRSADVEHNRNNSVMGRYKFSVCDALLLGD
jgi:hypothetical protein